MARLQDYLLRGDRASQPAAATVPIGTLYCVTDEDFTLERSSGAAWEEFAPVPVTAIGDVVGPAGAVNNRVALFDGVTGKLLKDSGDTVADIEADAATLAASLILPIDLAADVGATRLPYANLVAATAASRLVGRRSGSAGDFEEIELASRGLSMSAGKVLSNYAPEPEIRAALTPPVNADFAWINQDTASVRDDTDSVVLIGGAVGNASNANVRKKAAPATPYTITAYLIPTMIQKAFQAYGILFRESGTGKLHTLAVFANDLGLTTLAILSTKWASATSATAHYVTHQICREPRWFRIGDDGVNRKCWISSDGVDWLLLDTQTRLDHLTGGADEVGFFVSTQNVAAPNLAPIMRVAHWLAA